MKAILAAFAAVLWTGAAFAEIRPVTPIGDLERNSMVTLQGVVERITDEDEFILSDDTGRVDIYVGPTWVPVDVGERIKVHGFVDSSFFLEVYAREITRADGSIVSFNRRY